ncbi:MAG: hypothetical protein VX341_06275 [Bdellovibrionota bacterium]|nr:hypothetical protein [Bdellovibrionota bacterium]
MKKLIHLSIYIFMCHQLVHGASDPRDRDVMPPSTTSTTSPEPDQDRLHEGSSEESDVSIADEKVSDPYFCYEDGAPPAQCPQGQIHNCSVGACVPTHANEQYNEQYAKCAESENMAKCQNDLKGLRDEIAKAVDLANGAAGKDSNGANLAKIYNTGVGVAGLLAMYAAQVNGANSCTGGFTLTMAGAGAAMLGFMGMQSDQSGNIKKQLNEHLEKRKKYYDAGGWDKNSEVESLQVQIQYLKQIEMMSKQSADSHKSHRNFYGIVGAAAAACTASVYCVAGEPCAPAAIGIAAGGVLLENIAYNEASGSFEKAKKAREKSEAVLAKINKLYDSGRRSGSMGDHTAGTGNSQNNSNPSTNDPTGTTDTGGSDNGSSDITTGSEDGSAISFDPDVGLSSSCVGEDLSVSSSNCGNPMAINIPSVNTNIGSTLNKKLDFKGAGAAMSQFAKGNYGALNGSKFGTSKMSAISQNVFKRVADRALKINKKIDPRTKETLKQIAKGDLTSSLAATISKADPTSLAATLASRGGSKILNNQSGLDSLNPNAIANFGKNSNASSAELSGGKGLNTIAAGNKKSLSNFNVPNMGDLDSIDLGDDDMNDDEFDINKEMAQYEPIEGSALAGVNAVIHADQKISIFKIITNRYNYMRVRKSFGRK